MRDALDAVARRHPVLRTTYVADQSGVPHATVHPGLRPQWAEHDLIRVSAQAQRLRLEVLAQRRVRRAVRPCRRRAIADHVGAHRDRECVMLLVAHHIAWDDGSWEVFFADLTRAYTGDRAGGPSAARSRGTPRRRRADVAYWRAVMADPPEPLELPGPTGSTVPTGWRSARTNVTLSADTADRVVDMARATGCSPYAVLLAVFGTLVHRYTHADDFLVASPVLNRGAGTEGSIGYFGNTVAMRLRPHASMSFRECSSRPATRRSALSPTSGSISIGWCANSIPTGVTAPSG